MEDFINALYFLSEDCEYDAMHDQFIIVVGVKEIELSDDLRSRADLTLEDAIRVSRQWEAHKENVQEIRGDQPAKLAFVKSNRGKKQKNRSKPHSTQNHTQNHAKKHIPSKSDSCWFCGHERHP